MDLSFFTDFLITLGQWLKESLHEIGLAMVSTLLVIYGNQILALIKKQIGSVQPFLRITLFVLFCAFGFAFLTAFLTPLIVGTLLEVDEIWLPLIVIVSFYIVGLLAQRKGYI